MILIIYSQISKSTALFQTSRKPVMSSLYVINPSFLNVLNLLRMESLEAHNVPLIG